MEPRFNEDLGSVRVHTDSQAAESARALDANAFTAGREIYFAAGKYAPANDHGKRLLAHELVHTLQQRSTTPDVVPQSDSAGNLNIDPDPALESDADRIAEQVMTSGSALSVSTRPGAAGSLALQRQKAGDAEGGSSAPASTWLKPLPANVILHLPPAPAFAEMGSLLTGHPYVKEIPTANEDELRQVARANAYFESSPLETFEAASGEYLEERNKLTDLFERKAYYLTLYELTQSELEAQREEFRYVDTGNSNNPEIDQLRQAASHLAQVQQEIMRWANDPVYMEMNQDAPRAHMEYLDDYIDTPALWRPVMQWFEPSLDEPNSAAEEEKKDHEYSVEEFKKIIQRYKSLREIYGQRFPILLPRNQDYYTLANSSSDELAKYAFSRSLNVLNSIQEARKELSPSKIWSLPVIIDQTKTLLGIEEGTGANDAIQGKLDDMAFDDAFHSLAMTALQVGLQVVAAELTGGASLLVRGLRVGVAVAGAVVSADSVMDEWSTYKFQKAMSGNISLNPAVRLSQEDPSFTGLAFDIAFMVLDFHSAAAAFHHVLEPVKAAEAIIDVTRGVKVTATGEELAARASKLEEVEEIVRAQARVLAQDGKLAKGVTEEIFVERVMISLRRERELQGAVVELARAGETEALEAARKAARAGDMEEAKKLFGELEGHLSPEQANLLWRDLGQLGEAGVRLEQPITLFGKLHTLRLIQGERGAFFVLCSWCARVKTILEDALQAARSERKSADRVSRLEALLEKVQKMETNIEAGKGKEDLNTMVALQSMLTESEHLMGAALEERFATGSPNFSVLARDPAVAERARELYPGYYEQLMESREDIFRGRRVRNDLESVIAEEAKARALTQARNESPRGTPLELDPGAPARTAVNPRMDFPFGFYNRVDFDQFSQRLYGALEARWPRSELILEGSSVTGRRYDRLVDFKSTGAPFDLGRVSDYDIAIYSDALCEEAERLHVPIKDKVGPAGITKLGLTDLDTAAQAAILDATGIAHEVKFKIRPGIPSGATPNLPLPRSGS